MDLDPLQAAVSAVVQQLDGQPADHLHVDIDVFRYSQFCVVS